MLTEQTISEIKERVTEGIHINRLPKKTKEEFIVLANEEFASDYGMTLKWLLDFRSGLLARPNQLLLDQMEDMASEIASLKVAKPQEEKRKTIHSVSGKIIVEKEDKKDE